MASSNINMLKKTGNNSKSDECYTPSIAIEPLLPFLPKSKIIYECTSNKSDKIVSFLKGKEYNVVSSDGRDFFKDKLDIEFDIIVTNPPYSKKDAFIKQCYDLKKPFALLLPVSSLQGQRRGKWFKEFGIELLVLNKRIDFTGKGSPHFGVAWFCYGLLPEKLLFT